MRGALVAREMRSAAARGEAADGVSARKGARASKAVDCCGSDILSGYESDLSHGKKVGLSEELFVRRRQW